MEVHVCAQTGPGAIRRCLRGTTSVSAAIYRRMAKWDKCARGVGRKAFVRRRGKPWSYLHSTVCNVSRMAASYLCEPLRTDLATTRSVPVPGVHYVGVPVCRRCTWVSVVDEMGLILNGPLLVLVCSTDNIYSDQLLVRML